MRDFLIILFVFGSIPFIFVRPMIGVLMWSWIAFMIPHRLGWSFAMEFPVAMVIGSVTIVAWLISREPKNIHWNSVTVLMLLFLAWTNITTIFALIPDEALRTVTQFNKIILMIYITMAIMRSEKRLDLLMWVIVGSIAFYSFKGGVFSLFTGLQYRVWGPPGGVIEDNNALAAATVMIIPLIYYLGKISGNKWIRRGSYLVVAISLVSVIGSYSRGAFLGLSVITLMWWWRSRYRVVVAAFSVVVFMLAVPLVPQKYFSRVETIENYEEDYSATSRIGMWILSYRLAADSPIVGGGLGYYLDPKIHQRYGAELRMLHSPHSIYFHVLGAHGFVGLALFLALGIAGFASLRWIRLHTRGHPDLQKEYLFGRMVSITLMGYAVTGAFLDLATWDLPYTLLAIVVNTRALVVRKLAEAEPSVTERRMPTPPWVATPAPSGVASPLPLRQRI